MAILSPLHAVGRQIQRVVPPLALRVIGGLAGLVIIGTILLLLPGVGAERPLTVEEALFTAVSALSVTGLSIITPSRDLSPFGQMVLVLLLQVGGVGFMVSAVVVLRLLGRRIRLVDRLALQGSLGLLEPRAIVQLTTRVFLTVIAIEALGAFVLWLNWRQSLGPLTAIRYAVFHAVSAFCNAGFDLYAGTPGTSGIPHDPVTLTTFGMLIFLGGLGIPVMTDLVSYRQHRQLTLHTRITLYAALVLIVGGGIGLFLAEAPPGGVLAGLPLPEQLKLTFFQSVSARTAGIASLPNFDSLGGASQLILMVLMFIGCAPASMGGGITTGTAAVLTLAFWSHIRGKGDVSIAGRRISPETVRKASAVLSISLAAVIIATLLLLYTHPVRLEAALFEVISAFATSGLSLNFTVQLNGFGQAVVMVMMLWGRLGALTIFVLLTRQNATQRVIYPEEKLLIG